MTQEIKTKQPTALYILSLTAVWERFSYYGMRAFLVLYMATEATNKLGGMGWNESFSNKIYGIFTGLCYLFPLFGGYIADRYLGQRRSVLIGGILIMIGHFTCSIDNSIIPFVLGMTFLVLGNGFFKPTILTMVGDLYEQGDVRRDSAFSIYYMLFNIGAFIAPVLCGFLGETYGYRYGFMAAGFGMMFGLILYINTAKKYLGNIGMMPKHKQNAIEKKHSNEPLTKEEKDRIAVIFVLIFFVVFFWTGYEQAGSSMNLYTRDYIDRTFFGWTIPTTWFQAVNPIFIVILSPIFSILWIALAKKGKNPSTPVKMGIGMVALGLGFALMLGAAMQRGGNNPDSNVKASLIWLLGAYFLHTVGELCLSPIGYSMVTKLAPLKLASLFMGVWFLSNFLSNLAAGFIAGYVSEVGASVIFGTIAISVVIMGFAVFFISRKLVSMMHGRD